MKRPAIFFLMVMVSIAILIQGCENESTMQTTTGDATKLAFSSVPTQLAANSTFTVSVQAVRNDNSVDQSYTGSVTIAKSSGPGTLSGTLTRSAQGGTVTFTDLVVDAVGDYTFNVSAMNLTGAVTDPITSSTIVVFKTGTFAGQNGYSSIGTVEILRNPDNSEVVRTGSDFAVSGGAGSIGIWLTNAAGAVNLNNSSTKIMVGLITTGFGGVYEYDIPGGLGSYTHVVTFCEAAEINFGYAALMDP